ncbi:MAG: glucokinase [Candidatus Eisenbacteria bacterium]|nr:glucokinase [Candidatus Eisenbacteria bacterium]
MILAGDIGGTKTHLALFEVAAAAPAPPRARLIKRAHETFASREHETLDGIVDQFLGRHTDRREAGGGNRGALHACFGIAGPIRDQRVETTNLPWRIDAREMERKNQLDSLVLLNDLEANAHGIAMLGNEDVAVIQAGSPEARGNGAVISAGTGLGEAGLFWDGSVHHPMASEGGHADFAPSNEIEDELLRYLRARVGGHVSWERVLSGPGLLDLYCFLRDTGRGEESLALRETLAAGDPGAVISIEASRDPNSLPGRALDLFVSLYGAEAGNVALKFLSVGGIWIGGGIAPKNLPRLSDGRFLAAFLNKGRLRPVLEAIPVQVILNQETALLGAAKRALQSADSPPEARA